jgi:tetratricopeptide (TPR) repeat protein
VIELLLAAENALALGLLDQAERTYRQVLESDPRNGIAAVGLARVALERGDEADAIRLARGALDIDPENATARRMIDRLEEVARFRDGRVESGPAGPGGDVVGPGGSPEPPGGPPAAAPPPAEPSATEPPPATRPGPTIDRRGLLRRLLRRT